MSNNKKLNKRIANADLKFQKEQLQAAQAAEALSKAVAVVEQYKGELTDDQYVEVMTRFTEQKEEIQKFLILARDKYVLKLKELGDPRIDPETGELV